MSAQAIAGRETILKEPPEQAFILRERNHAIANISRRQDVEFFAQTPTGASVIGHGDNRREISDLRSHISLQSTKKRGKTCAAADGDNIQWTTGRNLGGHG